MFKWLIGMATAFPLFFTYRIMTGLGIAIITTTGWTFAVDAAFNLMASRISAAPADVLAILNIMGLPSALGIISGAIVSGFAVRTLVGGLSLGPAT